MKRYDIINHFINTRNLKSYLEIGVQHGECFRQVRCELKHSVDPDLDSRATFAVTSDYFFDINTRNYDIIFIDGLHTSKQVYKDIKNSLEVLNDNGVIIVHDCLPTTELMQKVPRETKEWTGDVWKGVIMANRNLSLKLRTADTDYGVGIIEKGGSVCKHKNPKGSDLTYENYKVNKEEWLNVIDIERFNKIYNRVQQG